MPNNLVALIPARGGSKRVKGKNIRELAGHPLVAYAIATAKEAGIFDRIVVSSDSPEILDVAQRYGAEPIIRPEAFAADWSPDVQWVNHAMEIVGRDAEYFCILRPTSPFRRGAWVRTAWDKLRKGPQADSIRAMRPAREHAGKMWTCHDGVIATPILPYREREAPWHSMPTQELQRLYVQSAALEIAQASVLPFSISGSVVMPYLTEADAPQAIDVNDAMDWDRAERTAAEHPDWLPPVEDVCP